MSAKRTKASDDAKTPENTGEKNPDTVPTISTMNGQQGVPAGYADVPGVKWVTLHIPVVEEIPDPRGPAGYKAASQTHLELRLTSEQERALASIMFGIEAVGGRLNETPYRAVSTLVGSRPMAMKWIVEQVARQRELAETAKAA